MTRTRFPTGGGRVFTRREVLTLAAAAGAAAALPIGHSRAAEGPVMTRPVPRTGERIPVVGLGTAIVFDIGDDARQRAERRDVIQKMIDGGARLIDTAPSYGEAEVVVGDLLAAMAAREKIFLATKVRANSDAEKLEQMNASLKRLRTNKVDLMQLHNVSDPKTQLQALREWQHNGFTRYVGITHFRSSAYQSLAEVMRREKPEFIQINYSLAERSAEERLLEQAADTGTAVLVNLPFGRGKLFRAVRGKPLPEWAKEFDATSWAQVFLKYLIAHPAVTCVIPGTDKPQYMADNLGAGRGRLPDAAMRKKIVAYWNSLS